MFSPGQIVYSRPGYAIMCIGDGRFLCGEKIAKIPERCLPYFEQSEWPGPITLGFALGMTAGIQYAELESQLRADCLPKLTKWEARGYALAMAYLSPEGKLVAWAKLQKTGNAFIIGEYINRMMVCLASGSPTMPEERRIRSMLADWVVEWEHLNPSNIR